ncbi:Myb-like protein [Actinidia chinensis var. chinensis]|uniref:Myb-like protein n=1 Tax=Actinidia chinensis var. chinensis TaxID=1590841 RepID=A0A2R6PAR2_ACTCC|nr:Myb-like protein [Actinidia chinensis var. chinensis]
MSSSSKELSTELGSLCHQNAFPADANLSNCREIHLEHEDEEENKGEGEGEDEEEDVDFNPFLKESPSLEASSSLSSEVEILDVDFAARNGNTVIALPTNLPLMLSHQVQDYALGDSEHGEEIVMQTATSSGGVGEREPERTSAVRVKKRRTVLGSQPENTMFHIKENGSSSGTDFVNNVMVRDITQCRKPVLDIDDEDAICKRTRARYSLASFTLDELETFLQETDDDDDLHNVDDEEEYRKFLAAVLQGGDDDSQIRQGNENVDDDDEENDADFEIEIEEALESDLDENTRGDMHQKREAAGRRPETRQNRYQKASAQQKKRILGQANRPLRPLLPNAPLSSFPVVIPETAPHFVSSSGHDGFINGFTPHQLGQLHCLIHEHVQLLIQVFSLCVLEPSRQHIASQIRELISAMLHKRDQVVSGRRAPYPWFCFFPPYIHPSVRHELSRSLTASFTSESACSLDEHRDCSSGTNNGPLSDVISPSKERSGYVSNGQEGRFQGSDSSLWVPFVNGPILSVLDVAPLNIVGKYMDDVSIAMQEHQRQYIEAACDTGSKKEPLFPFHSSLSFAEANAEVLRETTPPTAKVPSYPSGDQPPKRTLAAALVERTKKQPVALVSKEIAKLAHRFLPLFNPALFPHKPPPAPVASRVLFTDAEDELLALGLMEYNTDWKAIQQRFLPCKSKHQIFVRQKNRSSSKAPENPIKAVRRMKSSPLTVEEIARIQEGLKVFKLDWMSVWKFVVPYRDPSLLPRQWRIATGTQRSYKSTADKKEKRRLYASNRRKCKDAALATWKTSSEKEDCQTDNACGEINCGRDYVENEDEVYVHEAFLADWRPGTSFSVSSRLPVSNPRERNQPSDLLLQEGSHDMEQRNNSGPGESLPPLGLEFPAAIKYSRNLDILSDFTNHRHFTPAVEPNHPVSDMTLRPSKSQFCSRPYRSRRTNSARLVKLAPDLPPVNLPPSVRVMSQSAFKSYQCGASAKVPVADAATEKIVSQFPHVENSGSSHPIKSAENKRNRLENSNANQHRQECFVLRDKSVGGEKGESDLNMHPLLLQSSGNGHLPYYPLNCADSSPSPFNFFSSFQPQLNLSLLHNPHQANQAINYFDKSSKLKGTTSSAGGIDFHPLLQKADVNSDAVTAHSAAKLSVHLEPLKDSCAHLQDPIDLGQPETRVSNSLLATSSKSSSLNEKATDLDLDIHLSFSSRKEKAIGRRNVSENNPTASNLSALGSGTTMETQGTKGSCYQRNEYCHTSSILNRTSNKLDSGDRALFVSSNNISTYGVNNQGDQSLPEIVMEQEELSDSEEEIGEHVEFECEEMDDSEGDEGSDTEQIMNT